MQYSYDDTMKNGLLKSALFTHTDTLMFDWCCFDSATQREVGIPFGTVAQVSPTTIANREYCEKSMHSCKSWQPGHSRDWLPWSSAFRQMFNV